jgi:hypothetical protein
MSTKLSSFQTQGVAPLTLLASAGGVAAAKKNFLAMCQSEADAITCFACFRACRSFPVDMWPKSVEYPF